MGLIAIITSTGNANSTRLHLMQLCALPVPVTRAIALSTVLLIATCADIHSKEEGDQRKWKTFRNMWGEYTTHKMSFPHNHYVIIVGTSSMLQCMPTWHITCMYMYPQQWPINITGQK